LSLARGKDHNWKNRCYSQLATAMVRTPRWKFIDNTRNLGGSFELYDMRNDPKEQRNAIAEPGHRDMVEDFKRQLTTWRADKPAPVKIAGMSQPVYEVSDKERQEILNRPPLTLRDLDR